MFILTWGLSAYITNPTQMRVGDCGISLLSIRRKTEFTDLPSVKYIFVLD